MGKKTSAGLLMFRRIQPGSNELEFFIGHPGGPYWQRRNYGAWTIPKGAAEADESLENAARREFTEETGLSVGEPLIALGSVRQKGGKTIHVWAFEGEWDPEDGITSNPFECEWPPKSGVTKTYHELDRAVWANLAEAKRLLNPAQTRLLDRLAEYVMETTPNRI
ncbi:MAG: NUDIX domain-containing protein [Myxococcota bacterium]|nr:NUDIX domain-containing protein [Myxococcota bacterium]